MRRLIACALLVACGGEAEEGPDAALGAPDAFAVPVHVTPDPGDYALNWTCMGGCVVSLPAASYDRATITDSEIAYWRSECPTCADITDTITGRGEECVSGSGIPQGPGAGPTRAYDVCAGLGAATASVTYQGYPGPADVVRVWTMAAVPIPQTDRP